MKPACFPFFATFARALLAVLAGAAALRAQPSYLGPVPSVLPVERDDLRRAAYQARIDEVLDWRIGVVPPGGGLLGDLGAIAVKLARHQDADLCSRITTRCDLLMRVSPVPVAVEAAPTALPQLSRTPSTDAAHDVKSVDEAAIQAWMTSHEAVVPLATATPDQRFTIVWKYVGGSWPAFV